MPRRKPSNHRKPWTTKAVNNLRSFAKQGKSTKEIARRLGRTINAIYSKASQKGISLMPPDQ